MEGGAPRSARCCGTTSWPTLGGRVTVCVGLLNKLCNVFNMKMHFTPLFANCLKIEALSHMTWSSHIHISVSSFLLYFTEDDRMIVSHIAFLVKLYVTICVEFTIFGYNIETVKDTIHNDF